MTAATIMSTDVISLKADDSIAEALQLMCKNSIHNLPVLDKRGNFLGLFSLRRLSRELLPKAAKLDENSLLMHINFMPDSADELSERLIQLGQRPVSDLLEKSSKLRLCKPDTTLPELLQLLFESPVSLPVVVVEGKKKRLAGMVSNWDILTKLTVNLLSDKDSDPCKNTKKI
ncbi:CBS domain-containing protein [Candidatus Venteria ishoeyi]|uniref:CBS domain protein n=1 Tax=Candidatus Venteria ishoeyi TaxID=1899563 RepID=A0A1H6FE17_9GAMM|nr:CBS domain-containing protein [Candidatus Venteria ishoeyi]MDM8545868.1 CBS domain-containing protein [Candidatus Venteria ishoeyi]SEH08330.1 CBS domain protein [Candidatus Venteria ishoeyi]